MVNTAQFDPDDQNYRQLFTHHPVGKGQLITERGQPAARPFNQHPFSLFLKRPKTRREHRKRDWALLISPSAVISLPEATGLYPTVLNPCKRAACNKAQLATVFPTSVSVPVTK